MERFEDMSVRRASEWEPKCALRDLRRLDETDVEYFMFVYIISAGRLGVVMGKNGRGSEVR